MKKTFTLLFLFAATLLPLASQAQDDDKHCGTTERLRALYAKNPQLKVDQENFLKEIFEKRDAGSRDADSTTVYVIPIVYHIMHQYGSENISDAQVRNQVDILNRDFRKLNPDTIEIVSAFENLAADSRIEFRLASLDPNGNCTNGINHYYTHETMNGDDFSKLTQWPRGKYLNIWVVRSMEDGVAGYAYHPADVTGLPLATADGIMILNTYIGAVGTGATGRSRALTHEIGHYLSLPHTWGDTNSPGVACGDDGMADTPVTEGHETCTAADLADDNCTPGVIENTQNYMEYSYCQRMYTPDQVYAMRESLRSTIGNRNNLWTTANHAATGVDIVPPPVCIPVPDMNPSQKYICLGDNVTFEDHSWRANITSYSWSFPGGTPATSTAANPTITFNTPGWHDVTLTVGNSAGSETKTFVQAVHVSFGSAAYVGPVVESFESASTAPWWLVDNPESNEARWARISGAGATGSHCFKLNNHKEPDIFDPLYFNRLGGNKDALISPPYDLSHTTAATLSFKYACATHATTLAEQSEDLKVYTSTNCGKTWQLRLTINAAELTSAGNVTGDFSNPAGFWVTKTMNLTAPMLTSNTRFKFEYTASDYSNNIYLDDININGILGMSNEPNETAFDLNVYPNPSQAGESVNVAFTASHDAVLIVTDIVGKVVYTVNIPAGNQQVIHQVNTSQLGKGMYNVSVSQGSSKQTSRFILQ